jgi:hypothetical protein
VALTGLGAAAAQGAVGTQVGGSVTQALTGLRLIAGQGYLSLPTGPVTEGDLFFLSQPVELNHVEAVTDLFASSEPVEIAVTTFPDERAAQTTIPDLVAS